MRIGDVDITKFKMTGKEAIWVKSDIEYLVTNMQSLMSKRQAYGLASLDPKSILNEEDLQAYLDVSKDMDKLSKDAESATKEQREDTLNRVREMNDNLQNMLATKVMQDPQLMVEMTAKVEDQNEEIHEAKKKITELSISVCEGGLVAIGQSEELLNEMSPIQMNQFVSELMAEPENGLDDLQTFFTRASTSNSLSPQIDPTNSMASNESGAI